MIRYHAHIYFSPTDEALARQIWQDLKTEFVGEEFKLGPLEVGLRGPHLMSQFEIDFPENQTERVFRWLRMNRRGLSVLMHPEIDDEIKSHLNDAVWLGIPLPLNFSKLDLRIHGRAFVPFGQKPDELR
jgi:aromatic ring-cleaving dioxygenase